MGNYRFDDNIHEEKQLPAGQRGVGCVMMMLLPAISYVAAIELLKIKDVRFFFYRINPGLFGAPNIPKFLWKVKSLNPVLHEIYSWTNLEANILLGIIVLLVLSGVIAVFYALAYRMVAPSRYRGINAPPPRRKTKRKSR